MHSQHSPTLLTALCIWFLEVLEEEGLAENAERMGRILEQELSPSSLNPQIVETVRGRGLFWAIVIKETPGMFLNRWMIC